MVLGDASDTLDLYGNAPVGGPDAAWQAVAGKSGVQLDGSASGIYDFYDLVQNSQVIASVAVDHHVAVNLLV